MSKEGARLAQTAGRSARPKIRHRLSAESCTHRTNAGLPSGIPGIRDEIPGTIQQAPQPTRQSINTESRRAVLEEEKRGTALRL
jgi:hypothetical protein